MRGVRITLFIFLRRNSPYPLQSQFGLQIFVELVVMSKKLLQKFFLRPQSDPEKAGSEFLLHVTLEAAPRDEQTLVCAKFGDRA